MISGCTAGNMRATATAGWLNAAEDDLLGDAVFLMRYATPGGYVQGWRVAA